MSTSDKELEDKIREVGSKLESAPTSIDELLPLLDQTESLLAKVDQSPAQSMMTALKPAMMALVAKELLEHSDTDVRVSISSCISEITRITAPDAPYDDNLMKDVFRKIVESFEKLDDLNSRSYTKRVSILETVAKVRSCVVMLDLECDDLILDLFRHFLKTISLKHPENIFASMETIMSLVIEESEEISQDLVSCLLHSVKKDRMDVLPVSFRLGEKVICNCADKLKPIILELVQGNASEYSKTVTSMCQANSDGLEQSDLEASGKNVADDSKVSERTVSDELPQGSAKAGEQEQDQEQEQEQEQEAGSAPPNGVATSDNGEAAATTVLEPSSPKQKAELNKKKEGKSGSSNNNKESKDSESSGSLEIDNENNKEISKKEEDMSNIDNNNINNNRKRGRPKKEMESSSSKKETVMSDSEGGKAPPLRHSARKVAKEKEERERKKSKKEMEVSGVVSDGNESGEDIRLKEMIAPKSTAKVSGKDKDKDKDNDKDKGESTASKRKRDSATEKASGAKQDKKLDESIVGARIKVWWPDDKAYYNGTIDKFDLVSKKHTVVYDDGDVEVLVLKKEKWEFIAGKHKGKDKGYAKDQSTADEDGSRNKKAKKETIKSGGKSKESAQKSTASKSNGKQKVLEGSARKRKG